MQDLGVAGPVKEQGAGSKQQREKIGSTISERHRLVDLFLPSLTSHKEVISNSFALIVAEVLSPLEWDRVIPYWILFPTTNWRLRWGSYLVGCLHFCYSFHKQREYRIELHLDLSNAK